MGSDIAPHALADTARKAFESRPTSTTVYPIGTGPHAPSTSLYEDSLAVPLSTIDLHKTLAAKLCGHELSNAFNTTVVSLTRRLEPHAYVVTFLFLVSGGVLFHVSDLYVRTLASLACGVGGLIFCTYITASLLWDVLCLVVWTFDFWFLFLMNIVNIVLWCLLFGDIRAVAMLAIGLGLNLTTAVDANVYTRHLSARVYVLGAPAIFSNLILVAAHYPPDLHYSKFHVRGVVIDSVDLMVNVNLTVIYFMMMRGLHMWRLVISRGPVQVVRCDVFIPVCRLTPQPLSPPTLTQSELEASSSSPSTIRRMQLEDQVSGHAIDITQSLLPHLARAVPTLLPVATLNALGVVGFMCAAAAVVLKITTAASAIDGRGATSPTLSVISFVTSMLFVVVHAAHFQPKLVKRVLLEIDAWYVSFQISTTTLSMCDTIDWQPLGVLLFFTLWLWCHWTIFLDALPAITRRRLGFSRRLIVVVTTLLVLYPVLLGYYVYYSPARPFLRNRILLEMKFGATLMRMENFGFLASKLFMLSVWMLRSLWRELSRPVEAYKMIELRAFYNVNVV